MSDAHKDVSELVATLEGLLAGSARAGILEGITARGGFDDWMRRLRTSMSDHRFVVPDGRVELAQAVRRLDVRTRKDGFRVLHAWNHTSHQFTEDIVPILMIDFLHRAGLKDPDERLTLSIVLDYYFLHLLALCAMRAWDSEDPGAVLTRLTALVEALQGEGGSGHQFVKDAETLLIYALSQFHPEEHAYDRVIDKIVTVDEAHQVAFAKVSAAVLGAHLRWGFWLMYGRDVVRMRRDNVGDYPWLLNSVLTLTRAYDGLVESEAPEAERDPVLVALLQGLAADPWAFGGNPPPALAEYGAEYEELRGLLERHGPRLLEELERHRPTKTAYSPLSLHFNFPHNTLVAIVTLALLEGRPQSLPLNALFIGEMDDLPGQETQEGLARTLMAFSSGSPDRLGYRGAILVAYDPLSGMRSYSMTTKAIRESLG